MSSSEDEFSSVGCGCIVFVIGLALALFLGGLLAVTIKVVEWVL